MEADRTGAIARRFGDVFEKGSPVLRSHADGACALFERGDAGRLPQCAVHRTCGHAALPSACRHFPRIYLHDAYASRVTLSHYCPTAASLLFAPGEVRIVEASEELAPDDDREGLDARDALPPLLRPGMLMDVHSYGAWEAGAVRVLTDSSVGLDASVRCLASIVEDIRRWHPGAGALIEHVRTAFDRHLPGGTGIPLEIGEVAGSEEGLDGGAAGRLWHDVAAASVPSALVRPAPPDAGTCDERYVAAAWAGFIEPLRKYAASRLFGSWVAYQGRGLRTVLASVRCALAVVRIEAVRACAAAERPLDAALLRHAIRQAELLLVHQADRQELASRLSRVESGGRPAVC